MRRREFVAAAAGFTTGVAFGSSTETAYQYMEDRTAFHNRPKPDIFGLAASGIPLVDSDLFFENKKVAYVKDDYLLLGLQTARIEANKVYTTADGSNVYFPSRRCFDDKAKVREWKKLLTAYRSAWNFVPHYSVDAALLFANWILKTETCPWIGLATNALGTWEFLVNLVADLQHVSAATHMIETVDADSFIFTRLDITRKVPAKVRLTVFFQNDPKDKAIPLWINAYTMTDPIPRRDSHFQ
jgi:hypothetical protein